VSTSAVAVREDGGTVTSDRQYERILLASEGRPISNAAIAQAIELARPAGATVRVLSIARVHGVTFGMPNPGLLPTKKEWAAQRDIVGKAISRLKRKGIEADGHVVGTRNAAKSILREAKNQGCDAIVMSADPDKNRLVSSMFWEQEPQRVRRKAKLPVFLIVD
jgi:nucleotide-binding universal stress UspA family protein